MCPKKTVEVIAANSSTAMLPPASNPPPPQKKKREIERTNRVRQEMLLGLLERVFIWSSSFGRAEFARESGNTDTQDKSHYPGSGQPRRYPVGPQDSAACCQSIRRSPLAKAATANPQSDSAHGLWLGRAVWFVLCMSLCQKTSTDSETLRSLVELQRAPAED